MTSYGKISYKIESSSSDAPLRRKNRAELVNINELLKLQKSSTYVSKNFLNSDTNLNNRCRQSSIEPPLGKRAVSSYNYDDSKQRSKVNFDLNYSNIINKALSQVLIDFRESKLAEGRTDFGKSQTIKRSNANNRDFSVETIGKKASSSHLIDLSNSLEVISTNPIYIYNNDLAKILPRKPILKQKPPIKNRSRDVEKEISFEKRATSFNLNETREKNKSSDFSQNNSNVTRDLKDLKYAKSKSQNIKKQAYSNESLDNFNEQNTLKKAVSSNLNEIKDSSYFCSNNKPNTKTLNNRQNYDPNLNIVDLNYLNSQTPKLDLKLKRDRARSNAKVGLKINPNFGQRTSPSNNENPQNDNKLSSVNTDLTNNFISNDYNILKKPIIITSKKAVLNSFSQVEEDLLKSAEPILTNEKDELEIFGQRGIWLNKSDEFNWKGELPLSSYCINDDPDPEVITKKPLNDIDYIQTLAIRYLKPPTPPVPGEIIIKQDKNILTSPAPPLIIRQQPARVKTPEPFVIREVPPIPPEPIGVKLISIGGKRIPAPPRKVVIERLPQIPAKPPPILIERWLPYEDKKRKVIFEPPPVDPVIDNPNNVIIQWETPNVSIKKEFRYLGVIKADPDLYTKYFGPSLKTVENMPDFVKDIKAPDGVILAADIKKPNLSNLEDNLCSVDINNLQKDDFDLNENYLTINRRSSFFQENEIRIKSDIKLEIAAAQVIQASHSFANCETSSAVISVFNSASVIALSEIISQIFEKIDSKNTGRINLEDAKELYLRLNKRINQYFDENDAHSLFNLNVNSNSINLEEFKKIFLNLV